MGRQDRRGLRLAAADPPRLLTELVGSDQRFGGSTRRRDDDLDRWDARTGIRTPLASLPTPRVAHLALRRPPRPSSPTALRRPPRASSPTPPFVAHPALRRPPRPSSPRPLPLRRPHRASPTRASSPTSRFAHPCFVAHIALRRRLALRRPPAASSPTSRFAHPRFVAPSRVAHPRFVAPLALRRPSLASSPMF